MCIIDDEFFITTAGKIYFKGNVYDVEACEFKEGSKLVIHYGEKKVENFGTKSLTYSFTTNVKYENKTVDVSEDLAGSKFATWPGFAAFQSGKIALQDHGDNVWYRNIMIKEWNTMTTTTGCK